MKQFGIEAIQVYFPKTYVSQVDLEKYNGVSEGKYTKGLGQSELAFTYSFEDINSISLTVVNNLIKNHKIHPSQVGRLEIGTQTLIDKSKSTKTVLMSLFKGYHDIEGATSVNACYGGTNALINTLNWISSPSWDGRYGIVVAADIAVYEQGPARPTGGAGAVAMLIGPNPKISFSNTRASFIDHQWDFYKPIPDSEYPVVDGKVSQDCYLNAMRECYLTLKEKSKGRNILQETDYYCFHTPFSKMVVKAFDTLLKVQNKQITKEQIDSKFKKQVEPTLYISKKVGNSYTASLFVCLYSLLTKVPEVKNKKALLFSYGSGLCSSFLPITIHSNPLTSERIEQLNKFFEERISVSAEQYTKVMLFKEKNYGKLKGRIDGNMNLLNDNVYYLDNIDHKWRRTYKIKNPKTSNLTKQNVGSLQRIDQIDKRIPKLPRSDQKFYKMTISERREIVAEKIVDSTVNFNQLDEGGLTLEHADSMIENVIGKLSLPIAVIPMLPINKKKYMVPVSLQEPSVVAATSSIGKFILPFSFMTSSSPNIMIGQVHLHSLQAGDVNVINAAKTSIIQELNMECENMVKRGGGVKDLKVRELNSQSLSENNKHYSVDIYIDVCNAMGANITNTIAEKTKEIISKMGVQTGISVLTNYCLERKSVSSFIIPVQKMGWKGVPGIQVAEKIMEAYQFGRLDTFRAVTHNKGIMNGIDAVCIATGQDWRAVQSAAHAYASRSGKYMPLTHYQIISKEGKKYFKGILELPISVGTVGGAISRNQLYKLSHDILGNPTSQELSQIIVTVGLAQNLAALRALAIEGIQKGHMKLHSRAVALKVGVPNHLIDECCKYMTFKKRYDEQVVKQFLEYVQKPKL